jgi:hypothetical protein
MPEIYVHPVLRQGRALVAHSCVDRRQNTHDYSIAALYERLHGLHNELPQVSAGAGVLWCRSLYGCSGEVKGLPRVNRAGGTAYPVCTQWLSRFRHKCVDLGETIRLEHAGQPGRCPIRAVHRGADPGSFSGSARIGLRLRRLRSLGLLRIPPRGPEIAPSRGLPEQR